MAKYDDTFAPVKAKILRRVDRCTTAYNRALKERDAWARVPSHGLASWGETMRKREEALATAGRKLDEAHQAHLDYEYGDRPDGN